MQKQAREILQITGQKERKLILFVYGELPVTNENKRKNPYY